MSVNVEVYIMRIYLVSIIALLCFSNAIAETSYVKVTYSDDEVKSYEFYYSKGDGQKDLKTEIGTYKCKYEYTEKLSDLNIRAFAITCYQNQLNSSGFSLVTACDGKESSFHLFDKKGKKPKYNIIRFGCYK